MESPPDFSGKSGNRIRHERFWGTLSVTCGEDRTPPQRPSEEGTQAISDSFEIYWVWNFIEYLLDVAEFGEVIRLGVRASSCLLAELIPPYSQT